MDKTTGIGKFTHWAGQLFQKKSEVMVVVPPVAPPPAPPDAVRSLSAWQRFEATRTTGQSVRLRTQAMSTQRILYRSDRELNLGELLTVELGGLTFRATVAAVDSCRRAYAGELELSPTPLQRAGLLAWLESVQLVRLPVAPRLESCSALPVARPIRRTMSGDTRSRRSISGTRPFRPRSATGSRRVR